MLEKWSWGCKPLYCMPHHSNFFSRYVLVLFSQLRMVKKSSVSVEPSGLKQPAIRFCYKNLRSSETSGPPKTPDLLSHGQCLLLSCPFFSAEDGMVFKINQKYVRESSGSKEINNMYAEIIRPALQKHLNSYHPQPFFLHSCPFSSPQDGKKNQPKP
jgi:hypothetical protein